MFCQQAKPGGKKKALFLFCRMSVSAVTASNLLHHLAHKHPNEDKFKQLRKKAEQSPKPISTGAGEPNTSTGIKRYMKANPPIPQEERNLHLGRFIVKDLEPLSMVESVRFRDMHRAMLRNHNLQFPSRFTMTEWVGKKATDVKDLITNKINRKPVALTGDGWDSSNGGGSFYALTAHVMDPDSCELVRYTLACRKLSDRHTADNISKLNLGILEEYGIDLRDVTAFTSDTAANQELAIKKMGVPWVACTCHAFQLTSAVVMKVAGVAAVVNNCKSIVRHSHKSKHSRRELVAAQRIWKVKENRLKTWSDTRWWTLTDMVESVADNEGPIGVMIDRARAVDKKCTLPKLAERDYKICRELVTILSPTRSLQKTLEGEKYVTISHVDIAVNHTLQKLTAATRNPAFTTEVQEAAGLMEEDLTRRWYPEEVIAGNVSKKVIEKPLVIARKVAVLDVRTKGLPQATEREAEKLYWGPVEDDLRKLVDEQNERHFEELDRNMRGGLLFEESSDDDADGLAGMLKQAAANRVPGDDSAESDEEETLSSDHASPPRKKVRRCASIYDECLAELTRYRAVTPVKTKVIKEVGGPLKWWMQKQMFPTLSKLAIKYLAVQATSAASERLFSTAGLIMTDKRNMLNDENTENMIFLSSNHRLW